MRRILLPLLLLIAAGCASGPSVRRPAHASLAKDDFAATWDRALEVLRAEGYELGMADPVRGLLLTTERELQAPCGQAQCLSRETVLARLLPTGEASLSIRRQHWTEATGQYADGADPVSVEAVEKAEAALLSAITGRGADLRLSRRGEHCGADAECERGLSCLGSRCARR